MFKIHPNKWPTTSLLNKLFRRINWKLVLSFYLTIFIPLLYLINLTLIYTNINSFDLPLPLTIMATIIALLGIITWIISYLHLGKSFGVLPQEQKRIKTGLYKYLDHPMYFGISATMIGLSIANKSAHGLIFYSLIILPILIVRAKYEEKYLH